MRPASAVSSHLTTLGGATVHKSTPIAGVLKYRRFFKLFAPRILTDVVPQEPKL
jgi:hypothetical protein